MEYYSLTEEDVPIEYVQSYINEYHITEDMLEYGNRDKHVMVIDLKEDKEPYDYNQSRDYTFMTASDDTRKFYEGVEGEENNFPGFDEYWMGLYKKYFGEEFEYQE